MISDTYRARVAAPIGTVFDVLTRHDEYDQFTPLYAASLEREGERERNGTGAVRVLKVLPSPVPAIREEVVSFDPPNEFSYRLINRLPLKHHRGVVSLTEVGDVTEVAYRMEVELVVPLPGRVVKAALRVAEVVLFTLVSREAERRSRLAELSPNLGD